MIYHDVSVHNTNGRHWASSAAKSQVVSDGTCTSVVSFASRELRNIWSDAVIPALRISNPEALSE